MRYRYFRDHGYFIGSGVVEAACKTIVAQRPKGSDLHWSERGLGHVLSIRTALLFRRYDEFWLARPAFPHAAGCRNPSRTPEENTGRGQVGEASRPWTWILRERGMMSFA